jgi:hypothetical protein
MHGRIGSLHVRYRVPPGARFGPAAALGIDRALVEEAGEVVADRLNRLLGSDEEVVVVREATARLSLRPSQWSTNGEMLGRFGRAAADAVVDVIAKPPPDSVVRFADQAEFIGRFLVELWDGTAWDRWYYGAFGPLRRAGTAETAEAVFTEYPDDVPAVLGWLARHDQLSRFLRFTQPRSVRLELERVIGASRDGSRPADLGPLIDAAWRLLAAVGFKPTGSERSAIEAWYLERRPIPPSWHERRSLTAWVLAFMRFAAPVLAWGRPASDLDVRALLSGPLDWLDTEWLGPHLTTLAGGGTRVRDGDASVLTGSARQHLAMLTGRISSGNLAIPRDEDESRVVLRLVAALEAEVPGASRDRGVLATLSLVVKAWQGSGVAQQAVLPETAGPEARALLRALQGATRVTSAGGFPSRAGGLYLLVRALEDTRLIPLAARLGVPQQPLLAGLAGQLLSIEPPFDEATSLWIGHTGEHKAGLAHTQLGDLARELARTVAMQRGEDAKDQSVEAPLVQVVKLLLRAWSRWMPGFSDASVPFLVEKCLARESRIGITEHEVLVRLAPAPLDVVLRMAGYFQPIGRVGWLGGRRVVFDIADRWE